MSWNKEYSKEFWCSSKRKSEAQLKRKVVFVGGDLAFLQSLNLSKVVTCSLNPLRVCVPQVVNNFASITRTYQLAYCYTIMEHNSRNVIPVLYRDPSGVITNSEFVCLDTFFPFDPYLLKRSSKFITPIYKVYDGPSAEKIEINQKSRDDEDDFLMDTSTNTASLPQSFSYGSSPGFHL